MRATASFLAILMLSGCSTQSPAPIPTPDPLTEIKNTAERPMPSAFLPTREGTIKLAGTDVARSDKDGWTLRVANPGSTSAYGSAGGSAPTGAMEEDGSFEVGGLGMSG